MAKRVSGVVTLYHPSEDVIENIRSYLDGVDRLYIYDNSPTSRAHDFRSILGDQKVVYRSDPSNVGIAVPLNLALKESAALGYDWMLTMDQDSRFLPGGIMELKREMEALLASDPHLGIVAPSHEAPARDIRLPQKVAMTSGCLVNTSAAMKAGGWNEMLFLDSVDYDLCLRLRRMGYSIIETGRAVLVHKLGSPLTVNISGASFTTYIHDPIRTYYCFRNAFYLIRKHGLAYPVFALSMTKSIVVHLSKIPFADRPSEHFRMARKGVRDFFGGVYGKARF